jgi:hypothetical protein
MYKLPFWNPSKYTALEAHRWNQYLDEHPNKQHDLPIPTTPDSKLPTAPYPYGKADFYETPDLNHQGHTTLFDKQGNKKGFLSGNEAEDLRTLELWDILDLPNDHRLNPRMGALARHSTYVVTDSDGTSSGTPKSSLSYRSSNTSSLSSGTSKRRKTNGSIKSNGSISSLSDYGSLQSSGGYDSSKAVDDNSVVSRLSNVSKQLYPETPRRQSR